MQRRSGGCTCGQARYDVISEPMIVHCCHCRGCQKNSGAAFAVNALFEADRVELKEGKVEEVSVPTPSGTGQDIFRCAQCKVALWSNYNMGGLRAAVRFVRVGTLDDVDAFPPDVHIYTASKQAWVTLPLDAVSVDEFYKYPSIWTSDSLKRLASLREAARAAGPE